MANTKELTVDGFIFANLDDVELAKNEIKRVAYIENHTDMTNVSQIKALYNQAIENRVFQTPIGLEYLRELQNVLRNSGIPDEEIRPIPLYTTFKRISLKDTEPSKRRVSKAKQQEMNLRMKYRNAVLIAVIFGILVFTMIIITLNGSTPNALNYKRAITNQYAAWEQELSQREATVREKERELNIGY